jgi:hypothetical protein
MVWHAELEAWEVKVLRLTRILPKPLAKAYQEWDLSRAEAYLEYYEAMVRVLRTRVEEGREELRRLEGDRNC